MPHTESWLGNSLNFGREATNFKKLLKNISLFMHPDNPLFAIKNGRSSQAQTTVNFLREFGKKYPEIPYFQTFVEDWSSQFEIAFMTCPRWFAAVFQCSPIGFAGREERD
jgi:hypothetical protein